MVIVTSRLFDAAHSPLVLRETTGDSTLFDTERRLTRTATLDGGVALDDVGYSDGDRTLDLSIIGPPESTRDALQALMEADGVQRIATSDGVFEGGLERLTVKNGALTARFLVSEKLSA